MRSWTLSRRLFACIAAAIVATSLTSASLSYLLSFDDAKQLQDSELLQVATTLSTQQAIAPQERYPLTNTDENEGEVIVRALAPAPVEQDPQLDIEFPGSLPDGLQTITQSGLRWRLMVSRNRSGERFVVAQRQAVPRDAALDGALQTMLPMLVLVPLLLLIVHLLLRQGFARVSQLSRELDGLDDGRLVALDAAGVPSEVLPLVTAVNRLLERLRAVMEQQRRMVADAAHELRTPVAALRVQADNIGHSGLGAADARLRLEALQGGLRRISELIEQLMDLARVQSASGAQQKKFRFDDEVRHAIFAMLPLAEEKHIDLGCTAIDPAIVVGDPQSAYALVRNAIDNAVRYSRARGAVDVNVETLNGRVVFTVDDSGPGIAEDERKLVFEPFFRIPGTGEQGSGLGLAIASSAARALGGEVALVDRPDGKPGIRFAYTQPLA